MCQQGSVELNGRKYKTLKKYKANAIFQQKLYELVVCSWFV